MSTVAVRYACTPALSQKRQRALREAYAALALTAWCASQRDGRNRYLARQAATQCRALIDAFGVRRTRRFETTRGLT